jgi:predicted DCC family thiol-disulfide oxidoreductase YuxK
MPETNTKPIVIFDGVCGLCNRFVALSLKNDTRGELIFVPNRSEFGLHLCEQLGVLAETNQTIIVATNAGLLMRSDAVIFIASHLQWPYSCVQWLRVIPRPLRDLGYRCVATVRRLVPRNHDACEILPQELKCRIKEKC